MVFHSDSDGGNAVEASAPPNETHSGEPRLKKRKLTGRHELQGPSCALCRKRKAKCSRDQPCNTCIKLGAECLYDQEKSKPGMRPGAIETLSQRVSTLENMFAGQGILWQQIWNSINQQNNQEYGPTPESYRDKPIQQQSSDISRFFTALSSSSAGPHTNLAMDCNQPRGACDTPGNTGSLQRKSTFSYQGALGALPPDDLVDSMVDVYFQKVHPWIPMLHAPTFRKCLKNPAGRAQMSTILHAIVSLCVRISDDPRLQNSPELRSQYSTSCRQTVILAGMETFSVENLQALIICAFDTIGSGRGPSSWSIVGSMTRTVEQLRLSTEEDERQSHHSTSRALIKRMAFLPPALTWAEAEERRRVFWNVFLMDRFCSISTGWNLSLTGADVKRRLPCEGATWETGEPSQTATPFFGISTRSQDPEKDCLPAARETEDGQAALGGFAFCIEATESLSLVTSFFLQYEIDFKEVHEVQRWLMRFKQLDLRLVQWKFFLPEKWREPCHINNDGNLDPNLVLAHMTHNAALVLLHQGLAYPSSEWQSVPVRLPSASSAETCHAAAVEVATIAGQFLNHSSILISPQFSFCLFVCGKMLLTHAAYYQSVLHSSFESIVMSLEEISRRWNGAQPPVGANLASKFGSRLRQARVDGADAVDIREAFSEKEDAIGTPGTANGNLSGAELQTPRASVEAPLPAVLGREINMENLQTESPESISLAFPPLPLSFQLNGLPQDSTLATTAKADTSIGDVVNTDIDISGAFLDFYKL